MKIPDNGASRTSPWFRAWFALTPMERLLLASALFIFIIGLGTRHFYLKNAESKTYDPVNAEEIYEAGH